MELPDGIVGGLLKPITQGGLFEGDANTLNTSGLYYVNNTTQNVQYAVGPMLVLYEETAVAQITFNVFDGNMKWRVLLYNNGGWDKWTPWRTVSFT